MQIFVLNNKNIFYLFMQIIELIHLSSEMDVVNTCELSKILKTEPAA